MLQFLLLSILFMSTRGDVLDFFTGRCLPVVIYPNIIYDPVCYWHDVSFNRDVTCNCGDRSNVDVMIFKNIEKNETDTQAVIAVASGDEIANVIALNCTCTGANGPLKAKHPTALQKLNDNTYANYESSDLRTTSGVTEPNLAFVIVKTVPKLTELRDIIYSVDHLKTRKPGLMCEPSMFTSNSSNTQQALPTPVRTESSTQGS